MQYTMIFFIIIQSTLVCAGSDLPSEYQDPVTAVGNCERSSTTHGGESLTQALVSDQVQEEVKVTGGTN